jgi:hypothetical protein
MKIKATLFSLFILTVAVFFLFTASSAQAEEEFILSPVDMHFELVKDGLPTVMNVSELTFFGIEYRDTTDEKPEDGVISGGDTSDIDGVFTVTSFTSNGMKVDVPDHNDTWEMTATYEKMQDRIHTIFLPDVIPYKTDEGVGILTFYVSTDMTKQANADTGLGYDDGTMVAQFTVYGGGGVYQIIDPFDGSRDFYMLKQSGLDGFFDPEITGSVYDSNLDADPDNNEIGGDVPVPTNWPYMTDNPEVNYPWDFYTRVDGSKYFGFITEDEEGGCRMTGGGVDVNKNIVIGTEATSADNRYTYGGQIGAPTGAQPQPYGEWTHHQQKGMGGRFIFHSGTASAPKETTIQEVFCMDPGYCKPARPAPFKQLSWIATGSFRNISAKGINRLLNNCPAGTEIRAGKDATIHAYRVHIIDAGEPGSGEVSKGKGRKSTRNLCDLELTKEFPITSYELTDEQCANCPDTYQIEIRCTDDPDSDVMYSVGAFTDGGNLQIHPPVGEHMKP